MMLETMLESSQDFGMSNGSLPQWKRELLQRRAARPRGPPPSPPPAPPRAPLDTPAKPTPTTLEDDEELRYGPGIVKRLKSRYLSLALRDAPRRRPSVLRRATSLEHLLDEPAPAVPRARPASLAAPPVRAASAASAARRESVKRARSVDALSRLEAREPEVPRPRQQPAPPPLPPTVVTPSPPRAPRPPRRPQPLLTDAERPPPDVVRAALRKFEPGGARRPAPSARVAAVLRGLAARSSTPEPRGREPSPAPGELSPVERERSSAGGGSLAPRVVSRAALEGIARAGSTMRYSFPAARPAAHLPPLAATNPVLLARARGPDAAPRRVGVIRPLPPATPPPPEPENEPPLKPAAELTPRIETPPPLMPREESASPSSAIFDLLSEKSPPAALVETVPRSIDESPVIKVSEKIMFESPELSPRESPERLASPFKRIETSKAWTEAAKHQEERLTNGYREMSPEPNSDVVDRKSPIVVHEAAAVNGKVSRISAAKIERAWSPLGGAAPVRGSPGVARRARPPPAPAAVSVVFNFSNRKEVPDYIENDGIVLRAGRRDRLKPGDPGVVVLRVGEDGGAEGSDSEGEGAERAVSPCAVRFVNDNVLINGKSSLQAANKDRVNKLKLQFDDSLTRTFEYPSETSLHDDSPPGSPAAPRAPGSPRRAAPAPAPAPLPAALAQAQFAPLAHNTHIASSALARYTPQATRAELFELGVTRHTDHHHHQHHYQNGSAEAEEFEEGAGVAEVSEGAGAAEGAGAEEGAARSWSEARTHATDLLF